MENFYDTYSLKLQEKEFLRVFEEGRNPKEGVLKDPKNKDNIWEDFYSYNLLIKESMGKCPRIQWFEPKEYKDKLNIVPLLELLPFVRISRILFSSSIILRKLKDNH